MSYGQRGPRGRNGRGVYSLTIDSEGMLWAEYTDRSKQPIGPIPEGLPGEPGKDGRIQDVIVNGQSVVDSEGVAYITTSEGAIYTAGENIEISPENVISSPMLIDKEITVTESIGGYLKDDVIPANTPIRTIIETILSPAQRPVPPVTDTLYWGVGGDRRNPPVGLDGTYASESIDPAVIERYGTEKHYATNAQWTVFAFPASMPKLVYAEANDTGDNALDAWQYKTVDYAGTTYHYYYSGPTKSPDTKWVFKWRV